MPIFAGKFNPEWNGNDVSPDSLLINGHQVKVGKELYFYKGGEHLQRDHSLSPTWGFCLKLYSRKFFHCGYLKYDLDSWPDKQLEEVILFSSFVKKHETIVCTLPHNVEPQVKDPYDGKLHTLGEQFIAYSHDLPTRKKRNFSSDDIKSLFSLNSDKELRSILDKHRIKYHSENSEVDMGIECYLNPEESLSNEERITGILSLYFGYHYTTAGQNNAAFSANIDTWPYLDPSVPEDKVENWVDFNPENKLDITRAKNILDNISMHAMLFKVSKRQAKAIEESLIPLGSKNVEKEHWVYEGTVSSGRTEKNIQFMSTGKINIGKRSLLFLSATGKIEVGDKIFLEDQKRSIGKVSSLLWKWQNHFEYIVPEEQRGIGIAVI